jgi:hypothetical protein
MLFDTEWSGTLFEQFGRYEKDFPEQFGSSPDARLVLEQMLLGRMMQINDAVFRGSRYGGTPLIDAPTSWRYLQWKYEYQGNAIPEESDVHRDLLIAKTMALEGDEHRMLSGIPPEALIELRRNGASLELREMIRRGIKEIDSASSWPWQAVYQPSGTLVTLTQSRLTAVRSADARPTLTRGARIWRAISSAQSATRLGKGRVKPATRVSPLPDLLCLVPAGNSGTPQSDAGAPMRIPRSRVQDLSAHHRLRPC